MQTLSETGGGHRQDQGVEVEEPCAGEGAGADCTQGEEDEGESLLDDGLNPVLELRVGQGEEIKTEAGEDNNQLLGEYKAVQAGA